MVRPGVLTARPSILVATVGGAVAVVLLAALLHLAPVLGFPFVDFPRLLGGVFTGDPEAAFWIGHAIFLIFGWAVWPVLFALAWPMLPGGEPDEPAGRGEVPGDAGTIRSGALRGALWGALLWVLSGLLLPVLGWLSRLGEGLDDPGLFALGEGVLAAVGILLGHLAYGLALGLVATMGRGIDPLGTLGWSGYHQADAKRPPAPPQRTTYGA